MRQYKGEHTVTQAKLADKILRDLRITDPFPALKELADSYDLSSLSDAEHSHVPFAIILIKATQKWKEDVNEILPSNIAEKDQFKEIIKSLARVFSQEDCFKEAMDNVGPVVFGNEVLPYEI